MSIGSGWGLVHAARLSLRGIHPFAEVANRISSCNDKSSITLSVGDPTYDSSLATAQEATAAMVEQTHIPTIYGYQRFFGHPEACSAVASYWARHFANEHSHLCEGDNVIMTVGAAEAVLCCLTALCDEGDNVLLPAPGPCVYEYLCGTYGFEGRRYHLQAAQNWQVDLDELRSLVDDRTKALVLINPSNPCGSSWSTIHLQAILELAEELKVPIISDELYAGMVFKGETFVSVAAFETPVPRFIVGGLAKRLVAPGWGCGWVLLVDPANHAKEVLAGMRNLSAMSLGPNCVVQRALPKILSQTPLSYFASVVDEVESRAKYFIAIVKRCPGLSCVKPQGTLYILIRIHLEEFVGFVNDADFCYTLHDEENVLVLPGSCFALPGYFRICVTQPADVLATVEERLISFCIRHMRQ